VNIAPQINQRDTLMTKVPQTPLVPNNTLMTATPEEGRALAITLARHAMQGELEVLKAGRPKYADDAFGLIAAGHVVAIEFATIAAANSYWRR
jgi:Hexameric tyrosine-coordinated heme protein (HTHP)